MNIFFTSLDGQVWINKTFIKNLIDETIKGLPNKYHVHRFADLIRGAVDSCVYKDTPVNINDPEIDQFYCGSCRRYFTVLYKSKDEIRADWRPCSRCGAQSMRQEKNGKKDNSES
jgi:hypothetical protein